MFRRQRHKDRAGNKCLRSLVCIVLLAVAGKLAAQQPLDWERPIHIARAPIGDEAEISEIDSADITPADLVRQAFNDSIVAETARNFDDAIKALSSVDLDGPNRYFINVRLGWLHYLKGDFDKSIEYYRAAIEDNTDSTEARIGLMLPLIAKEKYEDLIEVAKDTIDIEPFNYLANLRLAFALRALKQNENAVQITAAMINRLPTDLDAIASHVLTLIELDRHDDADLFLHHMLLIDPDNEFAIAKLKVSAPLSEIETAGDLERHRSGASTSDSDRLAFIRAAFNRSFLAEKAIHYDDAIEELVAIGDPGDDRYFIFTRLGWLHYLRGNFGKSFDYYLGAIEESPESTEARVGYLLPLLANKQYDKVIEIAKQVLEVDPRNYYANLRLAVALRELKRFDDALQVIEPVLTRIPADLESMAEYSKSLVAIGRISDANAVYHRMLLVDPNNDFALTKLGLKPPVNNYFHTPETFDLTPKLVRSITPYFAFVDYGHASIKQQGEIGGLFFKTSFINSLELATEYTNLNYRDGFELHQTDFIANYNYFEVENIRLRLGGRVTSANNDFIDGSWVTFLGAHAYKTAFWDIGSDMFISQYDQLAPNKTIFQLSPHVGIETKPSLDTRVRLDFRLHYINTENKIASLNKGNFYSTEARLQVDYAPWSLAVFGWTGEQTFAVRNDGYIVYSLAELHTGGYGFEMVRTLNENSFLTLRFNDEQFADFQTLAPTQADAYSILYTYLW